MAKRKRDGEQEGWKIGVAMAYAGGGEIEDTHCIAMNVAAFKRKFEEMAGRPATRGHVIAFNKVLRLEDGRTFLPDGSDRAADDWTQALDSDEIAEEEERNNVGVMLNSIDVYIF